MRLLQSKRREANACVRDPDVDASRVEASAHMMNLTSGIDLFDFYLTWMVFVVTQRREIEDKKA